ncbi:MAG: type I methionyl aminopeptidase [Patescibacteria group bacterium]
MQITYKTPAEIADMKHGGKILGKILTHLANEMKPGLTTKMIDDRARELLEKYKVEASFLGYHGFPGVICTPVNEEVVHTIPGERVLEEGDFITLDFGVIYKGWHTDSAITIGVGKISKEKQDMIRAGEEALFAAIKKVGPGVEIRVISETVQGVIEKNGYKIIRELIGHGIGRNLHEDPQVPNYSADAGKQKLKAGMTIAIEPIFCAGKPGIKTLADDWNIVTKDGSMAAQVEHTIAITEDGYEILTEREDMKSVYETFYQS